MRESPDHRLAIQQGELPGSGNGEMITPTNLSTHSRREFGTGQWLDRALIGAAIGWGVVILVLAIVYPIESINTDVPACSPCAASSPFMAYGVLPAAALRSCGAHQPVGASCRRADLVGNNRVVAVRELSVDDVAWVAELMEQRRQDYARFSPVFWRPAADVTGLHARFLRRQISSDANVGLRTDHGFIIAQRRPAEGFVDDFAVDRDGTWDEYGAVLLLSASQRLAAASALTQVRVVTAHADKPKASMLASLSLQVAEQWWVREVEPAAQPGKPGRVDGTGFSGIFGPAPPVYDPGGPVLLADRLADDADIAMIEHEAAEMGSVLAIVPAAPGSARSTGLRQRDWSVASDWYLGWPETRLPQAAETIPGS